MTKETEFRAYVWIEKCLKSLEWDTRNPNNTTSGEVWNQNEALADPELKKALGAQKPESVCKIAANEVLVIEAKKGIDQLILAAQEARGYCEDINAGSVITRARIATGVAGKEAHGYTASSWLLIDGGWQEIFEGDEPCRRLLSRADAKRLLQRENAQIVPAHLSVNEAVKLAGRINGILHAAKVEKEKRALTVAFLILALHQDAGLEFTSNPKIFLDDINSRASRPFIEMGRQTMWDSIKISYSEETLTEKANGLSAVLEILKEADISNLAQDQDILGNFFESFLKYGNTSKELGVVLTPRHICRFAVDCSSISENDVVIDIAAGTGGFLVASYNRIKSQKTIDDARLFATKNLFGCEDSGSVAALAFINMYLRGDGKHNLKADSCFNWDLQVDGAARIFGERKANENKSPAATKVLMNPPFALKTDVQHETDFVEHALRQLKPNGVLFAILPASIFYDRATTSWRTTLLSRHKLLSVVSFPTDLFYPVSTETLGIFAQAWSPHVLEDDVLWARIADDGFVKKKRFRVERTKGASAEALRPFTRTIQNWIFSRAASADIPGVLEFKPLSGDEILPHVHLGTAALNTADLESGALKVVRNMLVESWGRPE
jgi:type I restriction enzyme M protein